MPWFHEKLFTNIPSWHYLTKYHMMWTISSLILVTGNAHPGISLWPSDNIWHKNPVRIVSCDGYPLFWCQALHELTHWGRDETNNILQTTFSNVFSSKKMFEFQLKYHRSLFPRIYLTIFQHWFRQRLGAVQATSHYLNQWWLVYWCIYASLGLNDLIPW